MNSGAELVSGSSTAEENAQGSISWAEFGRFYAEQMTLLDEGKTGIWGDTFTEDAIFVPPNGTPEVQGRAALKAGMEAALAGLSWSGCKRHTDPPLLLNRDCLR